MWLVLVLVALLAQTDATRRKWLAGTLRKSTFTQIYTTLTRQRLMSIWDSVCDPVTDKAGLRQTFSAALTAPV
jgi:hypothetical protein